MPYAVVTIGKPISVKGEPPPPPPPPQDNTLIYVTVGAVALGAVIFLVMRKR